MSQERRRTAAASASSTGNVASAHLRKPPRHGALGVGLRVDARVAVERPHEVLHAVAPETDLAPPTRLRAVRNLGVVLAGGEVAGGVGDRESGEVELVGALQARVGDVAHREAARRQLHADQRVELAAGVGARGPRPPDRPGLDPRDGGAVVVHRDDEVVEVVLEAADDGARAGVDQADASPVAAERMARGLAAADRARPGLEDAHAPAPGPAGRRSCLGGRTLTIIVNTVFTTGSPASSRQSVSET